MQEGPELPDQSEIVHVGFRDIFRMLHDLPDMVDHDLIDEAPIVRQAGNARCHVVRHGQLHKIGDQVVSPLFG